MTSKLVTSFYLTRKRVFFHLWYIQDDSSDQSKLYENIEDLMFHKKYQKMANS